MFVSKNQFFVFIACVSFGCVCALLLSFSAALKFFIKNKIIKAIPDVIVFLLISVSFRIYCYKLNFPNVRFYMLLGAIIGMLLYFKSFHILLAKYAKKFYNIINRKIIKNKKAKDERNKIKKVDSRNYGRAVLLVVTLVSVMVYQLISIRVENNRIEKLEERITAYEQLIADGELTIEERSEYEWLVREARKLGYEFK